MQTQNHFQLRLAQERRAEEMRAAEDARLIAFATRSVPRQPLRRVLGKRIIAIGSRLAADPALEPARSR